VSRTTRRGVVTVRRKVGPDDEVRVARITAIVIGAVAIGGGMWAKDQNIAFLVARAFADPVTHRSPSMVTDPAIDFHWFPLDNPGLVSVPLAFLLGWLATITSKEHGEAKYAEMEVRSLTGAGAEKSVAVH